MLLLGGIIRKHGVSFQCYTDDTQLYISSRPGETYQFAKVTECIVDIKNRMTRNFLLLNSEQKVLILTQCISVWYSNATNQDCKCGVTFILFCFCTVH